jgi:hypothetical protein
MQDDQKNEWGDFLAVFAENFTKSIEKHGCKIAICCPIKYKSSKKS